MKGGFILISGYPILLSITHKGVIKNVIEMIAFILSTKKSIDANMRDHEALLNEGRKNINSVILYSLCWT